MTQVNALRIKTIFLSLGSGERYILTKISDRVGGTKLYPPSGNGIVDRAQVLAMGGST